MWQDCLLLSLHIRRFSRWAFRGPLRPAVLMMNRGVPAPALGGSFQRSKAKFRRRPETPAACHHAHSKGICEAELPPHCTLCSGTVFTDADSHADLESRTVSQLMLVSAGGTRLHDKMLVGVLTDLCQRPEGEGRPGPVCGPQGPAVHSHTCWPLRPPAAAWWAALGEGQAVSRFQQTRGN